MENLDLTNFTPFIGRLSFDDDAVDLTFSLRTSSSGELYFEFPKLPLNKQTEFINTQHSKKGSTFANFILEGVADDGTRFDYNRFQLKSVNWNIAGTGSGEISIAGSCTTAKLVRPCDTAPLPRLTIHLKGFSNYGSLHSTCDLGKIAMDGTARNSDAQPDALRGRMVIEPEQMPPDVEKWRDDAHKLLEHIRIVMSLAAATMLKAPVRHYHFNDYFEVEVWSQSEQHPDSLRIIPDMAQDSIFEAAVTSFFAPPIKAINFKFAVEWFAMNASYNEVRLANVMTALENLVNSNLDESSTYIQPPKHFDKTTRPAIRQLIKACIERWPPDDSANVLTELNEKVGDLNRRSLYRKIMILAERWGVALDKIDPEQIRGALRARNSIVHKGHYYDNGQEQNDELIELWDHAMVVREIVARFLLTIVGYRGSYNSYIGGYHGEEMNRADVTTAT